MPDILTSALNAKVGDVMQALIEPGDNRVDAELCLDALAFVASVILDMDPHVATPSHLDVRPNSTGRSCSGT